MHISMQLTSPRPNGLMKRGNRLAMLYELGMMGQRLRELSTRSCLVTKTGYGGRKKIVLKSPNPQLRLRRSQKQPMELGQHGRGNAYVLHH
jgi:hypothetical protein